MSSAPSKRCLSCRFTAFLPECCLFSLPPHGHSLFSVLPDRNAPSDSSKQILDSPQCLQVHSDGLSASRTYDGRVRLHPPLDSRTSGSDLSRESPRSIPQGTARPLPGYYCLDAQPLYSRGYEAGSLQDSRDGTFFGQIPGLRGVWANEGTQEQCQKVLQEVLEESLILKIRDRDPIPPMGRISLPVKAA